MNLTEGFLKEAFSRHMLKALSRKGRGLKPSKAFKKSFADKGGPSAQKAWNAYKEQARRGGDESLLMWPVRGAARKAFGAKKVDDFFWRNVSGPALSADVAAGRVLEKIPLVGKKLFRMKENVPWSKNMSREVERPSALAPLVKARDIAEPIIVGVGLEKGIKKITGKKDRPQKDQGGSGMKQELREKVASVMLQLHEKNKEHEKRAQALRILFKQAELGLACPPQSNSELESKIASLVTEDLVVMEKALELAGGNVKLGELDRSADLNSPTNASEKFLADLLDETF